MNLLAVRRSVNCGLGDYIINVLRNGRALRLPESAAPMRAALLAAALEQS